MFGRPQVTRVGNWDVSTLFNNGRATESIAFERTGAKRQLYLPTEHDSAVAAMSAFLESGAPEQLADVETLSDIARDGTVFGWDES